MAGRREEKQASLLHYLDEDRVLTAICDLAIFAVIVASLPHAYLTFIEHASRPNPIKS